MSGRFPNFSQTVESQSGGVAKQPVFGKVFVAVQNGFFSSSTNIAVNTWYAGPGGKKK